MFGCLMVRGIYMTLIPRLADDRDARNKKTRRTIRCKCNGGEVDRHPRRVSEGCRRPKGIEQSGPVSLFGHRNHGGFWAWCACASLVSTLQVDPWARARLETEPGNEICLQVFPAKIRGFVQKFDFSPRSCYQFDIGHRRPTLLAPQASVAPSIERARGLFSYALAPGKPNHACFGQKNRRGNLHR